MTYNWEKDKDKIIIKKPKRENLLTFKAGVVYSKRNDKFYSVFDNPLEMYEIKKDKRLRSKLYKL
jgi:hypothetical protein